MISQLPLRHRVLLVSCLAGLFIGATVYVYVIRPRQRHVRSLENSVAAETERLRDKGWPVDKERLAAIRQSKQKELEALQVQTRQVIDLATGTFSEKISDRFENRGNFMRHVSRLDFQEYYVQIERELAGKGIVLAEEVLNLGEGSVAPDVYQLVLKLWTLEKVTKQALDHGLNPVRVPIRVRVPDARDPGVAVPPGVPPAAEGEPKYETRYVSKITLEPVRGYILHEDDESPYVLEFPITMTVRCQADELNQFLSSLHGTDTFIPLNRIQVRKVPPFKHQATPDLLTVDLECSVFFKLQEEVSAKLPKTVKTLPRGA